MTPYKDTNVNNFGGKPLSEYKNEIIKDDRYIKKMRHYQNRTPVKKESQWKEYTALIILILCGLIFMSGNNFNEECEKHGYFITQCN